MGYKRRPRAFFLMFYLFFFFPPPSFQNRSAYDGFFFAGFPHLSPLFDFPWPNLLPHPMANHMGANFVFRDPMCNLAVTSRDQHRFSQAYPFPSLRKLSRHLVIAVFFFFTFLLHLGVVFFSFLLPLFFSFSELQAFTLFQRATPFRTDWFVPPFSRGLSQQQTCFYPF